VSDKKAVLVKLMQGAEGFISDDGLPALIFHLKGGEKLAIGFLPSSISGLQKILRELQLRAAVKLHAKKGS
jgi:hypothetical protein